MFRIIVQLFREDKGGILTVDGAFIHEQHDNHGGGGGGRNSGSSTGNLSVRNIHDISSRASSHSVAGTHFSH